MIARLRIVKHLNKENGHVLGYSLQHKPFPFIPWWKDIETSKYLSEKEVEGDICFLLKIAGFLKDVDKFH